MLAAQLIAQGALLIGKVLFDATFASLTILTGLLVTLTLLTVCLVLPLALTALTLMLGALALTAIAPFIALAFASLGIGVELFLQIPEGLIGQALLIAQRLGQAFHRALPFGLTILALPLGDAHILHHALEFLQSLLRFGHAALLHQLLDPVHHAL